MTGEEEKPRLTRLELQFFADGSLSKWHKFAQKIGARIDKTDGDVSFAALPVTPAKDTVYLTGGFHHTGKSATKSKSVHWHLAWIAAPNGEPPPALSRRSQKVGGYPGVFKKIKTHWPHKGGLSGAEADFTITWDLGESEFLDVLGPPDAEPIALDGSTLVDLRRSRSWSVDPPLAGVKSITFTRIENGRKVQVSGEYRATVDAGLLSRLEASTWKTLKLLSK